MKTKVKCISLKEQRMTDWNDSFEIGREYMYITIDFNDKTILLYTDTGKTLWCDLNCFVPTEMYLVRCISKLERKVKRWSENFEYGKLYKSLGIDENGFLSVISDDSDIFTCDKECFKILEPINPF